MSLAKDRAPALCRPGSYRAGSAAGTYPSLLAFSRKQNIYPGTSYINSLVEERCETPREAPP